MKQFNKLIEFRQAVYEHGFAKAQDAQFELVDALLLSSPIRSFAELSLSPVFGDCKYSNHRFLGPLKDEPCGAPVRMRHDRVLCGDPGPYQGVGRPRVHGDRFAFKEPETWGEPDGEVELDDERWGKVRLRRWDNKHTCQDAGTVLSIILVETHQTILCTPVGDDGA